MKITAYYNNNTAYLHINLLQSFYCLLYERYLLF